MSEKESNESSSPKSESKGNEGFVGYSPKRRRSDSEETFKSSYSQPPLISMPHSSKSEESPQSLSKSTSTPETSIEITRSSASPTIVSSEIVQISPTSSAKSSLESILVYSPNKYSERKLSTQSTISISSSDSMQHELITLTSSFDSKQSTSIKSLSEGTLSTSSESKSPSTLTKKSESTPSPTTLNTPTSESTKSSTSTPTTPSSESTQSSPSTSTTKSSKSTPSSPSTPTTPTSESTPSTSSTPTTPTSESTPSTPSTSTTSESTPSSPSTLTSLSSSPPSTPPTPEPQIKNSYKWSDEDQIE